MEYKTRDFVSYTAAPTALDADGVCAAQQLLAAGDLLINGALASGGAATFGEQQKVTLYSTGNFSALTFTVYGTTVIGDSISEALAGPNNATVTTAANFKTVTRIASSAAVGTNIIAGNAAAMETPWIGLNWHRPLKGISVELSAGANLVYEVQYAARKRQNSADPETAILALADTVMTALNASAGVVAHIPLPAIRLKITSFVSGTAALRVAESPA
jgi:hypothetical protein